MPIPLPTFPTTRPANWTGAYGGTPTIPLPGESAGAAITADLSNLANLYNLAGSVNQFQTAQSALQYARNLPDYSNLLTQSSANIGARLRGEIAPDVISQIVRGGAERGILGGQAQPSPNVNAAILAAIGRTSEQEQILGEQQLSEAIRRTPTAPLFNLATMMSSPEEYQQAQAAANLYGAAPDPAAAARAAEQATQRGITAGAGAVGGAPSIPRYSMPTQAFSPSYGYGGSGMDSIVAPSLGGGTYIGGQYYPEGSTPQTEYQNWMNWWQSPQTVISGNAVGGGPSEGGWTGWDTFFDEGGWDIGAQTDLIPAGTAYDPFADLSVYDPLQGYGDYDWLGGDLGG